MADASQPGAGSGATAIGAGLMLLSGFAALAYQVLWVQQASLWLGQETAAVSAIVTAFFGGLAIGSFLAGRHLAAAKQPGRIYAACELLLAAWSLVLLALLPAAADVLSAAMGPVPGELRQWAIAFSGCLLLLLPGTVAMGATLPLLDRALQRPEVNESSRRRARTFGMLYAANTAGAMAGALAAAFWLIPSLGLTRAVVCCVVANLFCAVIALRLPPPGVPRACVPTSPPPTRRAGLLALLFATGLLGICHELALVRALTQVAESTVYTFAMLLAVYLCGTCIGASIQMRRAASGGPEDLGSALPCALAIATLAGLLLLTDATALHGRVLSALPPGVGGALAGEGLLALLVFLPSTVLMGMTFTRLVECARLCGIPSGTAIAVNILGATLAGPLLAIALMPILGLRDVLLAIATGYGVLAISMQPRKPAGWLTTGVLGAAAALSPPLLLTTLPAGSHLLERWEGRAATVAVVESASGVRTLHIDNRQQEGSSASTFADARQALLPLLLHPHPRRALFLGVGTGITSGAATLDPGLQIDAIELVPQVLEALPWFATAMPRGTDAKRVRIIRADALRFVHTTTNRYDVVVADNFHPARSGTGALYTREHFARVRQRLAPGGVFCQWLPLHQLDLESLRSVVRSFLDVYPGASAVLATYGLDTPTLGLVARDGGLPRGADIRSRLDALPRTSSATFDFSDEFAVLGTVVAGPSSLQAFAAGARANTEDQPVVAYRAPFETYSPTARPRDRLLQVLAQLSAAPEEILALVPEEGPWARRLANYWDARNRFLRIGRDVQAAGDITSMLQQVREPLLGVLRISPDFRPAYDPLLRMAAGLRDQDAIAARELLLALTRVHPARPEAFDLLGNRRHP